eukprot:TRINITY_DN6116_c0_g1_i3.p1 TRINITY_DN6116_c0_g1~~TRINITY_DN6116_c0_g1_i3.p1  ORF type:complete len:444 (-),score=45.06 TRINITY_DN6116_c0_g1_i3:456-1787(-)
MCRNVNVSPHKSAWQRNIRVVQNAMTQNNPSFQRFKKADTTKPAISVLSNKSQKAQEPGNDNQQAIFVSLLGSAVLQSNAGDQFVPLLHPLEHNVPFGMILRLVRSKGQQCENTLDSYNQNANIGSNGVYELWYILEGEIQVQNENGVSESLTSGDSFLTQVGTSLIQKASSNASMIQMWIPGSLAFLNNDYEEEVAKISVSHAMQQNGIDWGRDPFDTVNRQALMNLLMGANHSARRLFQITDQSAEPGMLGSMTGKMNNLRYWINYQLEKLLQSQWQKRVHQKRSVSQARQYRLPNQSNRLALVFDPTSEDVPCTFGIEIFEPSHRTIPHTHKYAHELFFILSGQGTGFCNGKRFDVKEGDVVVFPPTSVHGIDNGDSKKMYCLEMMLPNDMFAEFVKSGTLTWGLESDDKCILTPTSTLTNCFLFYPVKVRDFAMENDLM